MSEDGLIGSEYCLTVCRVCPFFVETCCDSGAVDRAGPETQYAVGVERKQAWESCGGVNRKVTSGYKVSLCEGWQRPGGVEHERVKVVAVDIRRIERFDDSERCVRITFTRIKRGDLSLKHWTQPVNAGALGIGKRQEVVRIDESVGSLSALHRGIKVNEATIKQADEPAS